MEYTAEQKIELLESEVEKLKYNEKNIFQPYWIPYYLVEEAEFEMTPLETKIYGFIRKVLENPTVENPRFYFSNDDLAEILNATGNSVSSAIANLKAKNIIETVLESNAPYGSRRYVSRYRTSVKTQASGQVGTQAIIKVPTQAIDKASTQAIYKTKNINHNVKLQVPADSFSQGQNPSQALSSEESVQSEAPAELPTGGRFVRSKIGSAVNSESTERKKSGSQSSVKRPKIIATASEIAVFNTYKEKIRPDAELFSPGLLDGIRRGLAQFERAFGPTEAGNKLVEAILLKMSDSNFLDYVGKNKGILTPPAFFSEKFIFNSLLPVVAKTPVAEKQASYGNIDRFKYETQDWWEKNAADQKTSIDIEREVLERRTSGAESEGAV